MSLLMQFSFVRNSIFMFFLSVFFLLNTNETIFGCTSHSYSYSVSLLRARTRLFIVFYFNFYIFFSSYFQTEIFVIHSIHSNFIRQTEKKTHSIKYFDELKYDKWFSTFSNFTSFSFLFFFFCCCCFLRLSQSHTHTYISFAYILMYTSHTNTYT